MEIFLETERLILRQFTLDDVDNLFALDDDPDVMRYLTGFWVAIERATGDFLGWLHFRPNRDDPVDQPELGYRLRKSAWGKGYATEGSRALIAKGFTDLGVQRVIASTYQDNAASRRVMEKCGMRLVRSHRPTPAELLELYGITQPELFEGDDVEYAITRSEWEAQRGPATKTESRPLHSR